MPDTSLGITYPASSDHIRFWEHFQALADDVNTVIAGMQPAQKRIATTKAEVDSATFTTTEVVIDSVTASLVIGKIYKVRWVVSFQSSVADDMVNVRIREDTVLGTEMQSRRVLSAIATAGAGFDGSVEAEYTAVATGSKTFVGTGDRSTGTGNITAEGAAIRPRFLYVDYIRDA